MGSIFDVGPVAAVYFSIADLPAPFVSHASSSPGTPFLKAASACLMWHLFAAAQALAKFLRLPSEHLRSSLVAGAHPGSSPPIGSPGPAWETPSPKVSRHRPPMVITRSRFMRPPPLACVSAALRHDAPGRVSSAK